MRTHFVFTIIRSDEEEVSRRGTVDAMDMVRDYLGREPKMEPFLKHLGL